MNKIIAMMDDDDDDDLIFDFANSFKGRIKYAPKNDLLIMIPHLVRTFFCFPHGKQLLRECLR